MATKPVAALGRLAGTNGEFYDPATNPLGLGDGGHRTNFPGRLHDMVTTTNYIAEVGAEVAGDRAFVSEALALALGYRDQAQAAAAAAQAYDPAPFNAHIANRNNPHAVTKAQVGLGNADNTSDANKPVSTAQATAIAAAETSARNLANATGRLATERLTGAYAFGSLLLSASAVATPLTVERTGSNANINMEFKGASASVFAGARNGTFAAGNSSDLSVAANRFFSASSALFEVLGSLTVGGTIDAGTSNISGSLSHSWGHMQIHSLNASNGEGFLRVNWTASNRNLNLAAFGDGSGRATIVGADIAGNANSADSATSATTATNCSRSIIAGNGLTGGGQLNANRTLNVDFAGGIAGMGAGTLGTYALLRLDGFNVSVNFGGSVAASGLSPANAWGTGAANVSGTWRCMGNTVASNNTDRTSLFLRIN